MARSSGRSGWARLALAIARERNAPARTAKARPHLRVRQNGGGRSSVPPARTGDVTAFRREAYGAVRDPATGSTLDSDSLSLNRTSSPFVPAKAGTQPSNNGALELCFWPWVPAFAGTSG